MSNQANTNLLERAAEACNYFEGTIVEKAIHNNLNRGDMEMVQYLVQEAEAEMSRQEFHNRDELPEREMPDVY